MSYPVRAVLLPFLASFLVAVLATWTIRSLAHRFHVLDKPGAHKQHAAATPTLGGIGVFLAFAIGLWLAGPLSPKLLWVLAGSALIVVVGLLDDLRGVSANLKLLTLALCSAISYAGGVHLDILGVTGFMAWLTTFLWLGLVASAFNGVDNADGAAAGLASISAAFAFIISWVTWQHELAVVSLALCGACLGFLVFNFPFSRASIFLGDSGSLFLGFGLSTITVLGQWSNTGWKSGLIAIAMVIVPLFDFLFILIVRGLEGRYKRWDDPIRMCARDHSFHRLRQLGLGPRQAVLTMYSVAALAGALCFLAVRNPNMLNAPTTLGALGLPVLASGVLLRARLAPEAYPEP